MIETYHETTTDEITRALREHAEEHGVDRRYKHPSPRLKRAATPDPPASRKHFSSTQDGRGASHHRSADSGSGDFGGEGPDSPSPLKIAAWIVYTIIFVALMAYLENNLG